MAAAPGPVPALPVQPAQQGFNCCSMLTYLAEAVVQLAVRTIFIVANILVAAALMPIAWHWIVLPIVAIGSTTLAAFFFPNFQVMAPRIGRLPMPRPHPMPADGLFPAHYPAGSPVGFNRLGQNCAFNAAAHFWDSDPLTAAWVRQPSVPEGIALPDFLAFLNRYNPPAELIAAFQQYVDQQPQPRPAIPLSFTHFLAQYQAPAAIQAEVRRIRGTYQLFQTILPNFYRACDEAVHARRAVSLGRSEFIRAGMSAVLATIPPNNYEQTDAGEIVRGLLDFAPDAMKPLIEKTYHYNMDGLPAMAEPRQPRQERMTVLPLPLDRTTPNGTPLETLIQRAQRNTTVEAQRYMGVDGQRHEYPVVEEVTEFIEPPPALRFQLNRFTHERPIPSLLSRWLPAIFPPINWRGVKLNTEIEIPDQLAITLRDGRVCQYRLASYVTHNGSYSSGHYVSGEVRGAERYFQNDAQVTHIETPEDQENWNAHKRQAYLLCYVPVPPAE